MGAGHGEQVVLQVWVHMVHQPKMCILSLALQPFGVTRAFPILLVGHFYLHMYFCLIWPWAPGEQALSLLPYAL